MVAVHKCSAALFTVVTKETLYVAVHKCSAALFTAVTKETLYHCCS